MRNFNFMVVTVLIFFIGCQWIYSFSFMEDPHTRRVACNDCHGLNDDHGFPNSGKHDEHKKKQLFNPQDIDKFENESYEEVDIDDPNPQDDILVPNETNWDLCDECHHTSAPLSRFTDTFSCEPCHQITPGLPPYDDPDQVLHINGKVEVVFMDTTASYNKTTRTCSGLSDCHTTAPTSNARWGSQDKTPKQLKNKFFQKVCRDCHLSLSTIEGKTADEIFLPQPINDLCNKCHGVDEDVEVKVRHFLGEEISDVLQRRLPKVFPFEEDDIFTCVTCHSPHGEICQSCHSLNDEGVNSNKDIQKVFGGKVYDPVDFGRDDWKTNTTPIRRGNAYLRTSEELNYDYYSHSFPYTEVSLMKNNFCVACHEMPKRDRVENINIHLIFQCNDCHLEIPYTKRICYKVEELAGDFYPTVDFDKNASLKLEINKLCAQCHFEDHFHVSKKRMIIQKKLPKDLPLTIWKEVKCTTCHDPHVRYGENGLIFRRLNSSGRGLCEECHQHDKKFINTNPHQDKNRCVYCHLFEPDRRRRLTEEEEELLTKAYVTRCEICHIGWKNTHPINVPPFDFNDLGLQLNRQNMITCASCHDYHDPEEIIVPLEDPKSGYCDVCHKN